MPSNDWRYTKFKPGKAHLWALTPGGIWRTRCNRLCVLDLAVTTDPLERDNDRVRKCRVCIPQEQRRGEKG